MSIFIDGEWCHADFKFDAKRKGFIVYFKGIWPETYKEEFLRMFISFEIINLKENIAFVSLQK